MTNVPAPEYIDEDDYDIVSTEEINNLITDIIRLSDDIDRLNMSIYLNGLSFSISKIERNKWYYTYIPAKKYICSALLIGYLIN